MSAAVNHVTWSSPGSKGVLALPLTKTGQRSGMPESVTIYVPLVAVPLYLLSQTILPGAQLGRGSPQDVRDEFRLHLGRVFMYANVYKPYCLRRGGATAHYIEFRHLQSTRLRERWNSYRSCQLNVVEGQREMGEAELSDATKSACLYYAGKLRAFVLPRLREVDAKAARVFFAALPWACAGGSPVVQPGPLPARCCFV